MRILLTGGGTLGSVSPLLALIPLLRKQHTVFFVGTRKGPEKAFIEQVKIPFLWIVAPKFRRYFSWRHLLVPIELCIGVIQAWYLLLCIRPQVIASAGGFVSLPLVWVGWLLRIPSVIHQQDIQPGLANKLMQPFARTITVTFEESLQNFPKHKTHWIGNPTRDLTPTTESIIVDPAYPTVFIFGGGTGAQGINELVTTDICEFANVIHVIGKSRTGNMQPITHVRYHAYELLGEEMKEAYAKANVVVCRAGLGTLSELAHVRKPAIVIPMPHSHQEYNAQILKKHGAALVLEQTKASPNTFTQTIRNLIQDHDAQKQLVEQLSKVFPANAHAKFIDILLSPRKKNNTHI